MGSLVFWQNIPSIHQAPLIREVAKRWDGNVWIVAESDVSSDRIRQGWVRPDFTPAKLLVAPDRSKRLRLLAQTQAKDDVHIFSGFHAYPETYWTMKQVRKTRAILGVFAERGKGGSRVRSILRPLRYIAHGLQWGRRLDFLLATGQLGIDWYSKFSFPKEKIFTFGYFIDPQVQSIASARHNDIFTISYVGGLVPWKGVDLLFHALQDFKSLDWVLQIVGDGPLRKELGELALQLGIDSRIVWEGTLPNDAARQVMANSDLHVLPSRYDGWGAVVNEALMAGTPVIVSDACGSSELIQRSFLGKIFTAGSVNSLREAIRYWVVKGKTMDVDRHRIQDWSAKISPCASAQYLTHIIKNVNSDRPSTIIAPWREAG
jgi:glycosyltransferase involved in cell wall biosynthesis